MCRSNVFFTADTHFGHANIIKFCARPFASVEEMDEILIENWNAKVREGDTVYILGDMFYRCKNVVEILQCLHGNKHLITGNHDGSWMGQVDLKEYFVGVDRILDMKDGERRYTLCHYPMMQWPQERCGYMIHGHIHNDVALDFWPLLRVRERVLNAGVDVNGYAPVSFDELLANNVRYKTEHIEYRNAVGVVGHDRMKRV